MDRFVCQYCKNTVIYGEIHPCFLNNYNHNLYSLSQLDEPHDQDEKNDKARYGHTSNSSDNYEEIAQVFHQKDAEGSKIMNYPPPDDNKKVLYKPDLKRKRKFSLFSDETKVDEKYGNPQDAFHFVSTSNHKTNEVHSREITTLKTSSANFEPDYKSDNESSMQYKRKPSYRRGTYDETNFEPRPSASIQAAISEEREMSLEETNKQSIVKYIDQFVEELKAAPNTGSEEADKDSNEDSVDLTYDCIAPEVCSQLFGRSEGIADNLNQTRDSFQAESAVAGPSGICADLLRYERRQIVCDICRKQFDQKSNFESHYRTHTGEKPFQCDICEKAFAQKQTLVVHYRTHTGEKPFECEKCGVAFAHKTTLDYHYCTNMGEKHFECDKCRKLFPNRSALRNHVRTHTGEKNYKCSLCGKAFTTNYNRNRHVAKIHEENY